MSFAPQTLIDLRRFLAEQYDVPPNRFGIRGVVTPRRPWGYHLGKSDIYSPEGMGGRDYSVRRPRDARGLSNASAGFDINIGAAAERKLVAYLVALAKAGKDGGQLVEVIGPAPDGTAKRWYKPQWGSPVKARPDHDWHIHISWHRDTEFRDKRPLFYGLFDIEPDQLEPHVALAELDGPEVHPEHSTEDAIDLDAEAEGDTEGEDELAETMAEGPEPGADAEHEPPADALEGEG